MKKTLIAFAAAAALTTSAFAEITFGAWLRVLTAPVASDGKDTVAAMGNSWGWGARTARVDIRGTAEDGNIGFVMGAYNDKEGGLGDGDDAYIWGKPVDAVKVSFGKFDGPTPLRGDICYGSWDWLRPTSTWLAEDEGLLMSGKQNNGLKVEITPVDGLYILAMAPIAEAQDKVENVYKNVQLGASYDIDGIGKIKAQFFGKYTPESAEDAGDDEFDKTIEAAFDLTAVENLWLGLGFQYKMNDKKATFTAEEQNAKQAMKIALGAKYQVSDMIGLSASAAFFTYDKDENDIKADPRFQAGAGVDAAVADGVSVSADVRYLSAKKIDGEKEDNSDHLAFSVGVKKNISSNGYMGIAAQAQTNGGDWANNVITHNAEKGDKLTWCVPVALSCWF